MYDLNFRGEIFKGAKNVNPIKKKIKKLHQKKLTLINKYVFLGRDIN
jgi:hypothetical protein